MKQISISTTISVLTKEELSQEETSLMSQAFEARSKAYAPYSEFRVGAAALLENGEIFAGSNQENSAYPSGLCAERVAMFYANSQYPGVPVKTLAIAAFTNGNFLPEPITPCGSCRQVLLESESRFDTDITIMLYGTESVYVLQNVKQLLPLCFEKSSLSR